MCQVEANYSRHILRLSPRQIDEHRHSSNVGAQRPGMAQTVCPFDDEAREEKSPRSPREKTGGSRVLDDAQVEP